MNKKLLRKIKQEGIPEVFVEGSVHSDIIYEYLSNKEYPNLTSMTDCELETYLDELLDWNWRILPSISPNFHNAYYFTFGGEFYDVVDEIEYREYLRHEVSNTVKYYLSEQETIQSLSSDSKE